MADRVVIDLGQDWSIGGDDRPAARRRVRGWVVAPVLVLTAVLTGGGEPVRPAFVAVAEVAIGEATVIGLSPDRVFVADREDSVVAERTWHGVIAAYALPGGARRWRTRVPEVVQSLEFAPGARVVLAATHYGGTGAVRTVALDAGTGRLLWSSASVGIAAVPAGGTQGLVFDQTAAGVAAIRTLDLRTGRTVWSRPVPEGAWVRPIPGAGVSDPFWVLMIKSDGLAELLAVQTGAVLDAGRLGSLRPSSQQPGGGADGANRAQAAEPQVNVVGGRVLVLRPPDHRLATLTAFDLATFTPQWTVTGDIHGYPNMCGPMICLAGEDGLTAVDPATGAIVWHTDEWQTGQMIDRDHLLVRAYQSGMTMALLDVRTGRVLMRMNGWTPVWDPATARPRLMVRPDTRRYGRFWFATLDPRYSAPSLLGDLAGLVSSQDCQSTGNLLACPTLRRTVQVWRLRT